MTNQEIRNKVFSLMLEYYRGAGDSVECWMRTSNALFGGMHPDAMIAIGRGPQLLELVTKELRDNKVAE